MTTGMAITVEPAITPPQSVPRAPSLKACSHTGIVWRLGPVHDHQGEDELVPGEDEGEDAGGDEAGRDQRQRHPHERPEAGGAVDPGRLLELERARRSTNPRSVQIVNGRTKIR